MLGYRITAVGVSVPEKNPRHRVEYKKPARERFPRGGLANRHVVELFLLIRWGRGADSTDGANLAGANWLSGVSRKPRGFLLCIEPLDC